MILPSSLPKIRSTKHSCFHCLNVTIQAIAPPIEQHYRLLYIQSHFIPIPRHIRPIQFNSIRPSKRYKYTQTVHSCFPSQRGPSLHPPLNSPPDAQRCTLNHMPLSPSICFTHPTSCRSWNSQSDPSIVPALRQESHDLLLFRWLPGSGPQPIGVD